MTQFTAQEIVLSFVFPTLGIFTGLAWFTSPIKAVQEANRRGTLGDLNPTPWSMMLGNCIGWVCYAYLYAFRWYATQNPVDLTGAITLLIPNATGLVLSVWFNLCASKLQYHSRLAKDIRSSVAEFVVRHEEKVRRQSMIKFREDIAAVADLEAAAGGARSNSLTRKVGRPSSMSMQHASTPSTSTGAPCKPPAPDVARWSATIARMRRPKSWHQRRVSNSGCAVRAARVRACSALKRGMSLPSATASASYSSIELSAGRTQRACESAVCSKHKRCPVPPVPDDQLCQPHRSHHVC